MAPTAPAPANSPAKKGNAPEKKYKCQFCNRAFSRSEHRSRHERSREYPAFFFFFRPSSRQLARYTERLIGIFSPCNTDTKERPFKCLKCRSTFVRRDLLLRHDRTVHAKDGGVPLVAEGRRRGGNGSAGVQKSSPAPAAPAASSTSKPNIVDPTTLEQIEASSDGMVDLETAAMLMTDFQHKAAAAATGQTNDRAESDRSFSPGRGSLLEPPVSYLSGNATLPQMPWDSLVSPAEAKYSSMSSSYATPDPSSESHQLPSALDRHASSMGDALAPSLVTSLPVSGNSTPNDLSPFPSMTGPVSPVNYRKSPGPSQMLTLPKAPQVSNDVERNMVVERIRNADSLGVLPEAFQLPSTPALNKYLATYFNLYHPHLPFLHQESFNPAMASPPLLLAVLSIGALYTFEREHAFMMHVGSKMLVTQFLQHKDNFDSRKCPLWAMQSTLLNMIFESWSGDPKGLEWTCSIKSLLANVSFDFLFLFLFFSNLPFLCENFKLI